MLKNSVRKRKPLSEKLKRALKQESGWRCAIPACRASEALEFAHIKAVSHNGDNDFYNMIVLCANCHSKFDRKLDKHMTIQEVINIKKNLMILNGRYGSFEIRIIEYFLEYPEKISVSLLERDFDIMYLIKDDILVHDGKKGANMISLPPKTYILTEKGRDFIERFKSAKLLTGTI